MPSYSVSLNAVVSPTGGAIARLDAVCAAGPATNYVVVADTANLAIAGGKFRGVAIEAAAGNQTVQIVDFGTVDLLTTVLTGTGDYVSVNAAGQLFRTPTATPATIGTLENGTIHVNVAIYFNVTNGDATSIQGATLGAVSAGISYVLRGDGTQIRSVRDKFYLEDFLISGVGPDETGVVPFNTRFQLALDTIPSESDLVIKDPSSHYSLDLGTDITVTADAGTDIISHPNNDIPTGTPVALGSTGTMPGNVTFGARYYTIRQSTSTSKLALSLADALAGTAIDITANGTATIKMMRADLKPVLLYADNEHGDKSGIHIYGRGPMAHSMGRYHIREKGTRKQGTAAKVTALTNGAPGGSLTITADAGTDEITYAGLDMATNTEVFITSTGTMPAGLASGVAYYVIRTSATTCKLATTPARALTATAIDLTSAGSGTITLVPGALHQTVELGLGGMVFVVDKARWIGRHVELYNCASDDNNCSAVIVDVPSDNVLRIYNPNTNATGTDYGIYGVVGTPTVSWWIDEPGLDIRGKDNTLTNLAFGVSGIGYGGLSSKLGALVEWGHPTGNGAQNVIRNTMTGCSFETDSATSGTVRDNVWMVRNTVVNATSQLTNFCFHGTNGLGELQMCRPSQCDTYRFYHCGFYGGQRAGVAIWSHTGQSKENRFVECQFGANGIHTAHAICVPADLKNTSWGAGGNPHWDMAHCAFGNLRDAAMQTGGFASCAFRFESSYSESCTFMVRQNSNTTHNPLFITNCVWLGGTASNHKSGQILLTNGAGPVVISGGYVDAGPNGHDLHMEINSAQTTREMQLTVKDWWMSGTSSYTRRTAFRASTFRGPFNFAPSGTFWLRIAIDGAASVEANLTTASFLAATGRTLDMAEIHAVDLAEWFSAQAAFAGAGAWGRGDDSYFYIRSMNLGAAQSIQVVATTHGAGTDANDKLGMGNVADFAGALTQMASDTVNLIDVTKSAGITGLTRLTMDGVALSVSGSDAAILVNDFSKRYNATGALGRRILENLGGLSGSNGVQPKNFGGQVTISAAATTAAVTFGTAEADANYRIGRLTVTPGAGFAAGSTRAYVTGKLTTGFTINLEVAPGGAVANLVDWGIER